MKLMKLMKLRSGSEVMPNLKTELFSSLTLKDAYLSGWFKNDTQELYEGYKLESNDILLDVGCGVGNHSRFCANFVKEIIIADIDQAVLTEAEKGLSNDGHHSVRTLLSDGVSLNLPDESVTKVVALEVLEHTKQPQAFLNELVRVAKKDALFLISVPHFSSESLQKKLAPECCFEEPHHINVFTDEALNELIDNAGLSIQTKGHYGFFWSMYFCFFWISGQQFDAGFRLTNEFKPVLEMWTRTWAELLKLEGGLEVKKTLDNFLPKSTILIAKKK